MSDEAIEINTAPQPAGGRPAGRAWKARLAESDLPAETRSLIESVVGRTRLRRHEQSDVADELIAHFEDALAAGASVPETIARFGNATTAAGLIRRGKFRQRSILWHAWRFCVRGALVLALFYAVLAIRYYGGRPTIRVDYVAELNKATLAVPESERAWPVYQQALDQFNKDRPLDTNDDGTDLSKQKILAWVESKQGAIQQLRDAATTKTFGYVFGSDGYRHFEDDRSSAKNIPRETAAILDRSLWTTNDKSSLAMINVGGILAADMEAAKNKGDVQRFLKDALALLAAADQMQRSPHSYYGQYFAGNAREDCLKSLESLLLDKPEMLTGDQWVQIAHSLARPRVAADLMDYDGARAMRDDLLQRFYTDDGHGDGRLTAQAAKFLSDYMLHRDQTYFDLYLGYPKEMAMRSLGPISGTARASRREMFDFQERAIAEAEATARRPLRESPLLTHQNSPYMQVHDPIREFCYEPLTILDQPNIALIVWREKYLGRRDGVVTAIALELYHRHYGEYPKSLDALVPALLPELPLDRITGEPLKYKIEAGVPYLYSIGEDRRDDGGFVPGHGEENKPSADETAMWGIRSFIVKGDWVVYPTSRAKPFP